MTAFVLMTAMPPTKGHMALIDFAHGVSSFASDGKVNVIFTSQPGEPYVGQRFTAIHRYCKIIFPYGDVTVSLLHKELPQDPATEGFWDMWRDILIEHGAKPGDYYVSSELYGAKLAEILDGHFMPFDNGRELINTKATLVREQMVENFDFIAPLFQPYVRTNIVVWGAESTGKTTLSKQLAETINGHWLFEYARPYLEAVGPEISVKSMTDIYKGQNAAELMSEKDMLDKPYLIKDTDLFTTIGYWEQPHWAETLGPVPAELKRLADIRKADLYIMTSSNIPFEEDPLRYGGDHRESPDEYWLKVADKYKLPLVVLQSNERRGRLNEAINYARGASLKKAQTLYYDRGGF